MKLIPATLLMCVVSSGSLAGQTQTIPRPAEVVKPLSEYAEPPKRVLTVSNGTLELRRCWLESTTISCQFLFTSGIRRPNVYAAARLFRGHTVVDDIQRTHSASGGYFLDREGKTMPSVTLVEGESIVYVQQFSNGTPTIKSLRLIASPSKATIGDIPLEVKKNER